MKKTLIVIIALAVAVIIAGVIATSDDRGDAGPQATTTSSGGDNTYVNRDYGLSFEYPEDYVLSEAERGSAHRGHYVITLVHASDAEPREQSEGPTAITFDIYQNNLDQDSLSEWFRGSNASNYKLTDGTYSSTTIAGTEAISYRWSGLYEADSIAFRHNGNVVMVSVTYIAPTDEIREVYGDVLGSLELLDPAPLGEAEAVSFIQGMWPELSGYPSDNLPPKRIETESSSDGWYVGFLTLGSGRPGILSAACYFVSHSKEVTRIADFTESSAAGPESIDLRLCTRK